jgi:MoxR-like ATPase
MSAPTFDISTVPVDDRDRVEALIPPEWIADAYVHRSIAGLEDFDLLDLAVEETENVMLIGPTGSSKTTLFRAYAAARRLPFALVESNAAMDVGTVLGRTTISPDGSVDWVDGELTLVVRYGGVVLVDEINMAPPRITAAFHQLLAVTRRMSIPEAGESIEAGYGGDGEPQPVLLGAALNPERDYAGTVRLNHALRNRFAIQLDWDYSREVESALVTSGRLLDLAESVRSLAEIRTPVSTNALMEFERHVARVSMDFACTVMVNRFSPEERAPIARALEAESAAIAEELG